MKINTKTLIGTSIILLFLLLAAAPAALTHAQAEAPVREYTLLEPLPCVDGDSGCVDGMEQKVDLVRYLNIMFKLAIGLAGVLAVFMIVVGGFQYATTDAVSGKSEGKERITRAIEGLLLVLVSYFILYTIDPRFVQFRTDLEPLGISENLSAEFSVMELTELTNLTREAREKVTEYEERAKELRAKAREAETSGSYEEFVKHTIEANRLESEAINIRSNVAGAVAEKKAIEEIRNATFSSNSGYDMGFDEDTEKIIEKQIQSTRDIYNNAYEELEKRGDIEKANEFKYKRDYTVFSLEDEKNVVEALHIYKQFPGSRPNVEQARLLALRLENALAEKAKIIRDPELQQKYITETNERIQRIRSVVPKTKEEIAAEKKAAQNQ